MYHNKYHIHFVGVGGIGMSGIAELLLNLGYKVSGSDLSESEITERLERLGGEIYTGHAASQISGADVIVTSSAIPDDNPEILAARNNQNRAVPIIPRAEMLAELMRLKYSIAIAGAHGKTSTTSIIASILDKGQLDPTVVIGGNLKSIGSNALFGQGAFFVAEADESDGSFLKMSPTIAVITNIDREHLDYYKDLDEIKLTFLSFIDRIPFYGIAVLCLDNEAVQDIIPDIKKRFTTYGMNPQADFIVRNIVFDGLTSQFSVDYRGHRGTHKTLGDIRLNLPGVHNVSNAMAGIVVGIELGIPFQTIKEALETHSGVRRRIEIKGDWHGVTVVDDYGHHPAEIKVTLATAKISWPDKRLVVVFQPHRYSRIQALFDDFARAFYQSDLLVVLPIYAASEKKIPGVDAEQLFRGIKKHGHKNVVYQENFQLTLTFLKQTLRKGDILLTLGAGDVLKIGELLLESGTDE